MMFLPAQEAALQPIVEGPGVEETRDDWLQSSFNS